MHYLPDPFFRSKDHRSPQSEGGDFLTSANLALKPLYLYNIGKLSSYVLRYDLEASGHAISASCTTCKVTHQPATGNSVPAKSRETSGWKNSRMASVSGVPSRTTLRNAR